MKGRRERKKAQTRELIRSVAQRMFDAQGFDSVTIADIARQCDVAVQTVFNHFPTKEELFFDGRTHWVDGPAEAVRTRGPGESPLAALRATLVDLVGEGVGSHRSADRRRYIARLEASDSLCSYERELLHQAETKLRAALLEAFTADRAAARPAAGRPGPPPRGRRPPPIPPPCSPRPSGSRPAARWSSGGVRSSPGAPI